MAAATLTRDKLRTGAKDTATTDLRDVPEGTTGKVILVNGLSWIRYWVRFDNGVTLGSISRHKLATKEDLLRGPDTGMATDGADGDGGDGAEAAADASGGVTTPNGTFIPQKHIDRAKAARARLTGG
jgi:hypothetical protein